MMAGRGAGKSFAAMWELHTAMMETPNLRARVIAPTLGDGIAAAVDGPNGLLTLSKGQARWLPSAPGGACVRYPNGSRVWIVGTPTEKDVDRLRALTNCVAEGSLIQTDRGPVPIEDVSPGDMALTRAGYRLVVARWDRGVREVFRLTTSDGAEVIGTGDHPVWTENRGWVVLQELVAGDILVSCESMSNMTESGTTGPRATSTSTQAKEGSSTDGSTKTLTAPSPLDMTSTTSTSTTRTTIRRTLSLCLAMSTTGFTWLNGPNTWSACGTPVGSPGPSTRGGLRSALTAVWSSITGVVSTLTGVRSATRTGEPRSIKTTDGSSWILDVWSAKKSSQPSGTTETERSATITSRPAPDPVPRNSLTRTEQKSRTILRWAQRSSGIGLRSLITPEPVLTAGANSRTGLSERLSAASRVSETASASVRTSAVASVERLYETRRVWDISVEEHHEMFVNGVLVHQCDFDVFEELFANPCAQSAFNQASLSRRRGSRRWLVSSTPRPHSLIKEWEKDPRVEVRRGTSMDNKHIPLDWLHTLKTQYFGTRLYRQEVLGEVIEDVEGALWKANDIERSRVTGPASAVASICDRVVVGVDPPTGQGTCGIVVVGQDANGHMYVLDDRSVEEASPHVWAARVKEAADTYDAIVVAEINQGGQMVKEVLNSAGHALPLHTVSATKSKKTRAEPIALLWEVEEQIVHMVTGSTKLIDQMCHPAGTMITTRRGQVPIEQVRIDDEVLTRKGFAPLRWVGQTGEADTLVKVTHSNGGCVTMTPCHPIWNPEICEFVSASSVRRGDPLTTVQVSPAPPSRLRARSRGGEVGTTSAETSGGTTTSVTRRSTESDVSSSFIGRFMRRITARFRKGSSSTTKTTTPTTINPRISWRSPDLSTTWRTIMGLTLSAPMSPVTLLRSGGSELGISYGRTGSPVMSHASPAAPSSSRPGCEPSIATSTVDDVVTSRLEKPVPVYNLQVADPWPHEFFADGVLVHNCEWIPGEGASPDRVDALVWACWFLRSRHTAEVRGATVNTGGPVGLPSALSSVRMGRY